MLFRRVVIATLLTLVLTACTPVTQQATPTVGPATPAPKSALSTSPPASGTALPKSAVKPQRGGTLVYAMSGEAGELDPHKLTAGPTRSYLRLIYNTLVNTDKDGAVVPELAESWSNPDPSSYVFKLRKGVKFHDGTDFNAEAVKFNFDRIMGATTRGFIQSYVTNIQSVEVVDDFTVKFNLKTPQSSLLGTFARYVSSMVSPAAVKKWGDELVTHPVGTGPFEFVEWVKDDHLTLKRFGSYWRKDEFGDALPYLDQLIVKPIPDRSVILTNLRTGNVDLIAEILPTQEPLVQADNNLKTVQYGNVHHYAYVNTKEPPFDNKALRQAVSWAIDRDTIVRSIFGGVGEPGRYALPSQTWAFDKSAKFYSRDLAKVKEKLAEAGKPNGFKFTAPSPNLELELRLAQAVKAQLADAGIDMEITPTPDRELSVALNQGKYQILFTRGSGLTPDPDTLLRLDFYSESKRGYSSPELDKLLDDAVATYDQAERKALYAKAQALILDEAAEISLRHGPLTAVMKQNVMGFAPNISIYDLLLDWVWIKK